MNTHRDRSLLRRPHGQPPLVVAHRGASGLAPENTLPAFRLAIAQGAPAVECDVHLSADGIPVIIHDATLDRTTNGTGKVADLPHEQLRKLDAGSWFGASYSRAWIPTLDETLALCAGKATVFVELKVGGGEALVLAAFASFDRTPGAEVVVITFDPELVRLVAHYRPSLSLGFLISRRHVEQHGVEASTQFAREIGASFIAPQHHVVDEPFIEAAHKATLPVSVWTVDDPDRMSHLHRMGVDALTTNRPDIALNLFRGR